MCGETSLVGTQGKSRKNLHHLSKRAHKGIAIWKNAGMDAAVDEED